MSLVSQSPGMMGLSTEDIDQFSIEALESVARFAARSKARAEIERVWPDWRQRNAALGLLSAADVEECKTHIQAQVAIEDGLSVQIDEIVYGDSTDAEKRSALLALDWPEAVR